MTTLTFSPLDKTQPIPVSPKIGYYAFSYGNLRFNSDGHFVSHFSKDATTIYLVPDEIQEGNIHFTHELNEQGQLVLTLKDAQNEELKRPS